MATLSDSAVQLFAALSIPEGAGVQTDARPKIALGIPHNPFSSVSPVSTKAFGDCVRVVSEWELPRSGLWTSTTIFESGQENKENHVWHQGTQIVSKVCSPHYLKAHPHYFGNVKRFITSRMYSKVTQRSSCWATDETLLGGACGGVCPSGKQRKLSKASDKEKSVFQNIRRPRAGPS